MKLNKIDNRIIITRIVKELKKAVSEHKHRFMVGGALNLYNPAQVGILSNVMDNLKLSEAHNKEDLIIEIMDYVEENSPIILNKKEHYEN